MTPSSTLPRRAVVFIDGQNLFHAAEAAFGYDYPRALGRFVCGMHGWQFVQSRLYTGVPTKTDNVWLHDFWGRKLTALGRHKGEVHVFTRPLVFRDHLIELPDHHRSHRPSKARYFLPPDRLPMPPGTQLFLPEGRTVEGRFWFRQGVEKGVDVRIAIDLIQQTHERTFDVGVLFSQDQDLVEAVKEVLAIAAKQSRQVDLYTAYPWSEGRRTHDSDHRNPVGPTNRIELDRVAYDQCLDKVDFRPRR